MEHAKTFILRVMKFYFDIAEIILIDVVGSFTEGIMYCVKFLLRGMAVVIICLLMAVTMPVWYLPYKYFIKEK